MRSESLKKAQKKYNQENSKYYSLKFNRKTDADIIEHLQTVPSVQGYIKDLIRADIGQPQEPSETE